jgi:hypothetical protein
MNKKSDISQAKFEKLLNWLDFNQEIAGQKYELIRSRLIKILQARGCHIAEELADETINRVAARIEHLLENYNGDPALYFYAVAKKVFLEFTRQPKFEELSAARAQKNSSDAELDAYYACLDKCLSELELEKREFIIRYYEKEKKEKLDQRKKMETEFRISSEVLRTRAFRIRKGLQKCVLKCVGEQAAGNVTF